jgi:wyosine [tRNA(Phe)-imidazoG37] synthetase (radical SAM superfamily)
MGEPTLASNLGPAINLVKSALGLPVAVFTNGSLLKREDVRRDLVLADTIIVKLDAPDNDVFQKLNRPAVGVQLSDVLQGLQLLRLEFKGKLAIDVMLTDLNRAQGHNLSFNIRCVAPDQVQLNTPLRPSAVAPLKPADVKDVRKNWFWNFKTITVYDARKPLSVVPLDEEETQLRQPTKPKAEAAHEEGASGAAAGGPKTAYPGAAVFPGATRVDPGI